MDATRYKGKRWSAADAHLNTQKKKNLDIITGANVTKVNLESNKAVSIDILYQNSFEKIYAANEIYYLVEQLIPQNY